MFLCIILLLDLQKQLSDYLYVQINKLNIVY